MWFPSISRWIVPTISKAIRVTPINKCHSIFGIKKLTLQSEETEAVPQPGEFVLSPVLADQQDQAIDMIKQYYLNDHVLARARNADLTDDRAIDEYLLSLIKQGNTLLAHADDGTTAGICVGFASSPVDAKNLRNYAFYRQDPNIKDFLYFMAKLQETPNLWETFKQKKIFEIKMLAVAPEFRRQGLATTMVDRAMIQAQDQGYNVIRMDCINPYDHKIAERNMLNCLMKFPLHKLRGYNAPFIKRNCPYNGWVRVYVATRNTPDTPDLRTLKARHQEIESIIE